MNRHLNAALSNLKACATDAPEGSYEDAKKLNEVIGDTCDQLMRDVRALGLKADNCDLIYNLEAAIYDYVKRSNPGGTLFPMAEGFGSTMDGEARDRVTEQTKHDRDFLRGIGAMRN